MSILRRERIRKIKVKRDRVINLFLIVFVVFLSVSAIAGGIGLIFDPSGENLGISTEVLEGSLFDNFLIPGLFLFFVLGVFSGVIAYGLVSRRKIRFFEILNIDKRKHWSITFSFYIGIILVLWLSIQLLVIREYHILHFIYTINALLIMLFSYLS